MAARENSASGRTMHSLPEIVRAIALNNKIDESRDFARHGAEVDGAPAVGAQQARCATSA